MSAIRSNQLYLSNGNCRIHSLGILKNLTGREERLKEIGIIYPGKNQILPPLENHISVLPGEEYIRDDKVIIRYLYEPQNRKCSDLINPLGFIRVNA
jgi:hypothetical protein